MEPRQVTHFLIEPRFLTYKYTLNTLSSESRSDEVNSETLTNSTESLTILDSQLYDHLCETRSIYTFNQQEGSWADVFDITPSPINFFIKLIKC